MSTSVEEKRLTGKLLKIIEVPDSDIVIDKYGFTWKEYFRYVKLVGYEIDGKVTCELGEILRGKVVRDKVKLCTAEEYEWHFTTEISGKPILIRFSPTETERIEKREHPLLREEQIPRSANDRRLESENRQG